MSKLFGRRIMRRSSPPRTTIGLSKSIHQQLNAYAIAAGAAGVGLLALAQPAEARIIYTKIHHVIGDHSQYLLTLDNKTSDFVITNTRCPYANTGCTDNYFAALSVGALSPGNAVVGTHGRSYFAAALKQGARISKSRRLIRGGNMVSECQGFCTISGQRHATVGPWDNVTDRYLGLQFKINGKVHYGWARLNVKAPKGKFRITATLTGYAYETIPGKAIIAGATTGPDDSEPTASFTTPNPVPATLSALAMGAPGLSIWRRKESVVAAPESN
jgi:hypothetical protein